MMPEKRYRSEIEGLRTVATLLVAMYHIWFDRVSGGIDVFFVLSGFLITTTLLNRIEKTGKLNFGIHILNTAKRLFPLAYIVIFVTAVSSLYILPEVQWDSLVAHIYASIGYFENWRLSLDAVDYLAREEPASPFQHYWSLSVQGQFYVVWPFIIFFAYFLARKIFKTPIRKTVLAVLVLVFVASISYSIYKTNVNQPWAYFDSFARAWEFSIGGMFALLLPYLKFNKNLHLLFGWLGLVIICLTGIVLPVSDVFPGYAAALPITGALMVLVASENHHPLGVDRLLSLKIFTFLGGLTYGFYLWHWPLLIFYKTYMQTNTVPFLHGLFIIIGTFILSFITTKLVENPIRSMKIQEKKKKLIVMLSLLLFIMLSLNISIQTYLKTLTSQTENYVEVNYPGAMAMQAGFVLKENIEPIPATIDIKSDLPDFYQTKECFSYNEVTGKTCSYGVTENPKYTVALVGGSHAGHWFPALVEIAEELNFRLDIYEMDACRFSGDDFGGILTETCLDWNSIVIEKLRENPPDFVFTNANLNNKDHVPIGFIQQWEKLDGYTHIFALRDNPRMDLDVPTCVGQSNDYSYEECSVARSEKLSTVLPWDNTEGIPSNVYFADLSDYFCDETTCEPVIGNVVVFRDKHHLTATFSKTLAVPLKEQLQAGFKWLDQQRTQ